MRKLDPNAKVIFYFAYLFGFAFVIILFPMGVMMSLALEGLGPDTWGHVGTWFAILVGIIVLLPVPLAHLTYENYKYELQDAKIHIEKGIIWKKYVSIPYDRIQNVDILRGPVARMLDISDVQIQTAGAFHVQMEGRIPGVSTDEAVRIRDHVLKKMRPGKSGV